MSYFYMRDRYKALLKEVQKLKADSEATSFYTYATNTIILETPEIEEETETEREDVTKQRSKLKRIK